MFEIQTNDHHYLIKSILLGLLILVLGIIVWTTMFAQNVVKIPLSIDHIVTQINSKEKVTPNTTGSRESKDIVVIATGALLTSGYSSGFIISTTGVVLSSGLDMKDSISDTATVYARRVEALISIKGQETRVDMIYMMNKFLVNYTAEHPMYRTIVRMVDIITLGDVAHKLEYCTQYEGNYVLELFGMPLNIYSTIKYNNKLKKCQITYKYPDQSVHVCSLSEQQKTSLARAMKQKQGLNKFVPDWAFESVVEGFLSQDVCFESKKKAIIVNAIANDLLGSGSMIDSGSISVTGGVTGWWKNRTKK